MIETMKASRSMILNSASILWATDGTSPFEETAGAWTASTRSLSANNNPPTATPFTSAAAVKNGFVHIGSSTGSAFPPGDYRIESRTSNTAIILAPDPKLPLVDLAAVSGYVHPVAANGVTGGATVVAAQKAGSFMNDAEATIIDGIEFTFITAATATLTIYAADGSTVLYTKSFPSGTALGSVYPIAAPNGLGFLGGFSASLGVASSVYIANLLFRSVTAGEISGPTLKWYNGL